MTDIPPSRTHDDESRPKERRNRDTDPVQCLALALEANRSEDADLQLNRNLNTACRAIHFEIAVPAYGHGRD